MAQRDIKLSCFERVFEEKFFLIMGRTSWMSLINIFSLKQTKVYTPKTKKLQIFASKKYKFNFDCEQEKYNIYLNSVW